MPIEQDSEILRQIEEICSTCIMQMFDDRSKPVTLTLNRQTYHWHFESKERDCRTFARYVYVLSVIHRLVRTKSRMNLRELFYSQVNLFQHQRISDSVVDDIAQHLSVERRRLGLVATAKGLCAG
jgi:DNA topoisomerase VI subunit A